MKAILGTALLSAGLFTACAPLGTKSKFNAAVPLNGITNVALTISSVELPQGVTAQQADSAFVKEVATQLAAATGWRVTYVGEANAVLQKATTLLQEGNYQALAHAELQLRSYGVMRKAPRFNAWTRMQIFKIPEKQLLGESHFNTLMGKSYGVHPELPTAILDGVTGLMPPWQKRTHPTQ